MLKKQKYMSLKNTTHSEIILWIVVSHEPSLFVLSRMPPSHSYATLPVHWCSSFYVFLQDLSFLVESFYKSYIYLCYEKPHKIRNIPWNFQKYCLKNENPHQYYCKTDQLYNSKDIRISEENCIFL